MVEVGNTHLGEIHRVAITSIDTDKAAIYRPVEHLTIGVERDAIDTARLTDTPKEGDAARTNRAAIGNTRDPRSGLW